MKLRGLANSVYCDVEGCLRVALIEHSRALSSGVAMPNSSVTVRFNLCGEHSELHHAFTESGLNFTVKR